MRNALTIARREWSSYFTTPLAYIVFTGITVISSFFFVVLVATFKQAQDIAQANPGAWNQIPPAFRNLTDGVVVQLFSVMLVVSVFVGPLLSMRLFSEERRQKTFELLMTAPVRPIEIVLGKYLGGLGVIVASLGLTIVYPIILSFIGSSQSGTTLEWSTVLLGYTALLFFGASTIAIGMFISSLTDSQMLAGILSLAVTLVWWLIGAAKQNAEEPIRSIIDYISFETQTSQMMRGVLDLKALVFFISIISFSLLLTHRSVEAQRWT